MFNKTLALTAISLIFSSNVLAKVETYPASSYCNENITKKNAAFEKLLVSDGNINKSLKRLVTEEVGADAKNNGFIYNPSFERSSREFICNIPLNDEIGKFKINLHAQLYNMKDGRPGGCTFNKIRRIHDGEGWKIFSFRDNGGFTWTDLAKNGEFVDYSQYIDNQYERSTSLQINCRTTWDQGSIVLNHIELEY